MLIFKEPKGTTAVRLVHQHHGWCWDRGCIDDCRSTGLGIGCENEKEKAKASGVGPCGHTRVPGHSQQQKIYIVGDLVWEGWSELNR